MLQIVYGIYNSCVNDADSSFGLSPHTLLRRFPNLLFNFQFFLYICRYSIYLQKHKLAIAFIRSLP